jgi:hypothetical protein
VAVYASVVSTDSNGRHSSWPDIDSVDRSIPGQIRLYRNGTPAPVADFPEPMLLLLVEAAQPI